MATDYFGSLGFKQDQKLVQKNRNIRKYLKNHKGTISKGHKARLLKLRSENHAKLFPTDPDTGQSVVSQDKTAQAAARAKYGSTRASYDSLEGVYNTQLANLDPYFNQYRSHLNTLATNAVQQAQAQQQAIMDQQAQANTQAQKSNDALAERAAGNPAAQEALQAASDAAAGRQTLANLAGQSAAERGQIRGAQFSAQSANTGLQQNETRQSINANLKKLIDDRNNLDQQIGDYFQQVKDSNKASFLDNQLKVQAAKLAGAKFKVDTADKAADNARADRALDNTIANTNADNARADSEAASGSSGGKKKPKFTQSQLNATKQSYRGARDTATDWIKSNKLISQSKINANKARGVDVRGVKPNVDHYVGVLAKKLGGTRYKALARAAIMDAIYGGVDAATRKRIQQDYGITLRLSHSAKSKKK